MQDNDIMTLEEAALYLKVHMQTMYRWAQTGYIPASKVGGSWRLNKERVNKWLESLEAGKQPGSPALPEHDALGG